MTLDPDAARFWLAYVGGLPPDQVPQGVVVTAEPAGSPEITDRLLDLYLDGTKTAGSILLEDFTTTGDPVPQVGDHWIALGGDGEPRCILRTTRVDITTFAEVTPEITVAEGEGDLSVAYWKRVHAEIYTPYLAEWGLSTIEDATVVTEHFEVVFRGA